MLVSGATWSGPSTTSHSYSVGGTARLGMPVGPTAWKRISWLPSSSCVRVRGDSQIWYGIPSIEQRTKASGWSTKKVNVAEPDELGFGGAEVNDTSGKTPVPTARTNSEKPSGSAQTTPATGSLVTVTSIHVVPS